MGMPGMHGMYWNNTAISEADLILGIGMRFDDRVTGRLKDFAPKAKIVHIDIDPAEIGKNLTAHVPIVGDVKQVLIDLNREVAPARHDEWRSWLKDEKEKHPSILIPETEKILPQYVIKSIYDASGANAYYVTGVGQHQMWAAQYFWIDKPNGFITSGGLGTMGFEVPAAMGAQVARPDATVWSICGDGGFQMTLQELATMVDERLPVKMAIMNNGYLGMVRQWQELFYKDNYVAVAMSQPDFVKLAEAYGIKGMRITDRAQVDDAIREANAHPGPVLLDFQVEAEGNVWPMVPAGASLMETVEAPRDQQEVAR
jgi:acetolactate synthase-1/2/3 large subunit